MSFCSISMLGLPISESSFPSLPLAAWRARPFPRIDRCVRANVRVGSELTPRDGQNAQRFAAHLFRDREDLFSARFVDGARARRAGLFFAHRQEDVGTAFRVRDLLALLIERDDGHPLAIAVERNLFDDLKLRRDGLTRDAAFGREREERAFRRVAHDLVGAVTLLFELRVVCERRRRQEIAQRKRELRDDLAGAVEEIAFGIVAGAGRGVAFVARVDFANGHLVLGERAGLVGADDGRRAERLDGRELANDGSTLSPSAAFRAPT